MKYLLALSLAVALPVSAAGIATAQDTTNSQQSTPATTQSDSSAPATPDPGNAATNPEITTNSTGETSTAGQGDSNVIKLSGCLRRGSSADEYSLRGQTANSWELKSSSVDLSTHLEQVVEVTAVKSPDNDGTLIVTGLKMISNSCTR